MSSRLTATFPFLHYGDEDGMHDHMYRVTYIQSDHSAGLNARAPIEKAWKGPLGRRSWRKLLELVDSHLDWYSRTETPFVSVWSDRTHAVNFAKRMATKPATVADSVTVSAFYTFYQAHPMINVEEYVRYRRLPMRDYYRHEWLVLDEVPFESLCGTVLVSVDANGSAIVADDEHELYESR